MGGIEGTDDVQSPRAASVGCYTGRRTCGRGRKANSNTLRQTGKDTVVVSTAARCTDPFAVCWANASVAASFRR